MMRGSNQLAARHACPVSWGQGGRCPARLFPSSLGLAGQLIRRHGVTPAQIASINGFVRSTLGRGAVHGNVRPVLTGRVPCAR